MEKDFLKLVVLCLGFACVLESVAAVPATRSLMSREDDKSPVQGLLTQEALMDLSEGDKELLGYINIEGRMALESNDYGGTGANRRHDPPKPPGRE